MQGPTARRRVATAALRITFAAALLWLAARAVDLSAVWAILKSVDPLLFGLAASYVLLLHGLRPLRWLWLLRSVLPQVRYGEALRSSLFGAAARLVLPSKLGELGRVLVVAGLKPLPGVGLALLDLLMEVTAAFALAIPAALILGGPLAATVMIFFTALSAGALFRPHRVLAPLTRLPGLDRLRPRLQAVQTVSEKLGHRILWRGLGLSAVLHAVRFGQLYLLLQALGHTTHAAAVVLFPLVQLADGFPLTLAGLGAREWLGVWVLPQAGVRAEAALAAVTLQFVLISLLPGLVGWALNLGRTARSTESMKET